MSLPCSKQGEGKDHTGITLIDLQPYATITDLLKIWEALGIQPRFSKPEMFGETTTNFFKFEVVDRHCTKATKKGSKEIRIGLTEGRVIDHKLAQLIKNGIPEKKVMSALYYLIMRLLASDDTECVEKILNRFFRSFSVDWKRSEPSDPKCVVSPFYQELFEAIGVKASKTQLLSIGESYQDVHVITKSEDFISSGSLPSTYTSSFRINIIQSLVTASRKKVAEFFESGDNEMILSTSFYYLVKRMRMLGADEDPRIIIHRFEHVMRQDNFLSNERNMNTIRLNNKLESKSA